ncbi:MAG: hypothetical protein MUC28_04170 [Planctomycetes bacterium]|jgi:hypothetical protein|nr:hypothetical protein [Planctomycetota bacterium]
MIIRNFFNGSEYHLNSALAEHVREKIKALPDPDQAFLRQLADQFAEEFGVIHALDLIDDWPAKVLAVGRVFTRNKKIELKNTRDILAALQNSNEVIFHADGQNCS